MWLTVRLLLIMSILMDLETKYIDYTVVFVHAPIDCLVYNMLKYPKASLWTFREWHRNSRKACPRNFFIHTRKQLQKLGFVLLDSNPFLFISPDVICLLYVDDALLFYKDAADLNNLTKQMKDIDIQFMEEEDVASFLGVHIDQNNDDTINLTQKGLAERIVSAQCILMTQVYFQ